MKIKRKNYHAGQMSCDYEKLRKLLDDGYVVACYVNYKFCIGEQTIIYRDIAKAKSNDYNPNTDNYGYCVEARGICYLDWKRNMRKMRDITFEQMCEEIKLEFIDYA